MHPLDLAPQRTILIISNEKIDDIMEIVKSLEDTGLLITFVCEINKSGVKERKCGIFCMVLGTLGASLLKVLGKLGVSLVKAKILGTGVMRAGEGTIRTGQDF